MWSVHEPLTLDHHLIPTTTIHNMFNPFRRTVSTGNDATVTRLTSAIGEFDIVDKPHETKESTAADWVPPHWLPRPVPESYDIELPPWLRPTQTPMSFVGVDVIDVENGKLLKGMTVKLKDGKIQSISKSLQTDLQEPGITSVNAKGLYMCPGLIDCE